VESGLPLSSCLHLIGLLHFFGTEQQEENEYLCGVQTGRKHRITNPDTPETTEAVWMTNASVVYLIWTGLHLTDTRLPVAGSGYVRLSRSLSAIRKRKQHQAKQFAK